MHVFRLKTPYLDWFGLNLGLNNLKFGQKAICDWIESIWLIRSEMAFWPNFKLFRPKFSPNRTKNGIFSLKTCVFDQIDLIGFTQKFLPHLFREIFANTKLSIKFRIKFEYEKNFVLSFAKQENPEIIFFRIALLHVCSSVCLKNA